MTPPGFFMSLHDFEGVPDQCKFIDVPGLWEYWELNPD